MDVISETFLVNHFLLDLNNESNIEDDIVAPEEEIHTSYEESNISTVNEIIQSITLNFYF